MFGSDKAFLSISINDATIKVAQVRPSGVVEKVARASAGDSASVEDLSRVLKSILNGFDRKAGAVCVIPAGAATSKNIEVPSSDPNEIRSIINLQASRHTPYSREEVLIGYINLGTSTGGNTKIMLVIVHRNVVKDRLDVLEKCGLTPEKVLFVPEGIGRLYAKGLNLKKDAAPLGVIDCSVNSVNFLIVSRGSVVFTRSIPLGIKHAVEDANGPAKIAEELNKSLTAYQSEDIDAAPTGFVLTTDNEAVKSMLPALQDALKSDVRISPYISLVKANSVKNKLQRDFADDSFLDVIAPVASLAKAEINLMPEEIALKRTVEKQSTEATHAGLAALGIMLLLGAIIMVKIYFKDAFLNKNLRDQYAAQKQEVLDLQAKMAKNSVVKEYLQGRMVSLETINELYRVTPNDIYLTGVSLDEEGNVTAAGVSPSMSQVFSYVKAVDDSPMFNEAKTKSTSTRKDAAGKDTAVFELTFKLDDGR
jgi:hypothetical protein